MVAAQNGPQLESKQWETAAFIPFYCEVVAPFKKQFSSETETLKSQQIFEGRMLHPYCNLTFTGPHVS